MHIRTILAIARKDALDIIVNKSTLFSLLSIIFVAVLFLIVNNLLITKETKILVYDPGNSGVERVISSEYARPVIIHTGSADEVSAAFGPDRAHKASPYAIGVVVPADFVSSLRSGHRPRLSLYINGDEINNLDRQITVQLLTNFASSIANPRPLDLALATINPSNATPIGNLNGLYQATALLTSFITGASLVSSLLVEEKEKKTIRMLMVAPASFLDIALGKLLVGLGYQLLLSLIVLFILQGFTGNVPILILFLLLGTIFSLSLGLLVGSIFQSTGAVGGFIGGMSMFYVAPAVFVGPLAATIQGTPVETILKLIPTYYIAQGIYNAVQNLSTSASTLLDGGVLLASIVVVITLAVWALRRQAAVVATI